jgi:hypothetical protein
MITAPNYECHSHVKRVNDTFNAVDLGRFNGVGVFH